MSSLRRNIAAGSWVDASRELGKCQLGVGANQEERQVRALGVILAGGRSRRFGSAKAFAEIGGSTLVERVRLALAPVSEEVVAIGDDPRLARSGIASRPDLRPGSGPVAGLQSALSWARERALRGVLLTGCDMPFLSSGLLRHILRSAAAADVDAVVPEADTSGRLQPLCGWYSVQLLPAVEDSLSRDELSITALLQRSRLMRVPLEEVREYGEPSILFFNVNTLEDRLRAERLIQEGMA